mgnify:FL=1
MILDSIHIPVAGPECSSSPAGLVPTRSGSEDTHVSLSPKDVCVEMVVILRVVLAAEEAVGAVVCAAVGAAVGVALKVAL